MATNVSISTRYGTHLPALIKAMQKTTGDVLELGIGVFSTPFLHYQCLLQNRKLVSYENCKPWFDIFTKKYGYNYGTHEMIFVEKYSDAQIDKPWNVVLIDQTPDSSRREEIKRLANLAKYIIIHDSNDKHEKVYHYSEIYPLFKYRTIWNGDSNEATVLSNFHDLSDFWK